MDNLKRNLLKDFVVCTGDDLMRFNLKPENKRQSTKTKRKRYREFIRYLVSVATHPIGLLASASPYNSSQEYMLAYLTDLFSKTDSQDGFIHGVKNQKAKEERLKVISQFVRSTSSNRTHSWRPELRLKLEASTFTREELAFIDSLMIRVYVFKKRPGKAVVPEQKKAAKNPDRSVLDTNKTDGLDDATRGFFKKIFGGHKLDSSTLIRPVREMRRMFKFEIADEPINADDKSIKRTSKEQVSNRTKFKMMEVKVPGRDETKKEEHELNLSVRRYYFEPNAVHVLRLEFWLDMDVLRPGCLNRLRSLVRRLVYNKNFLSCSSEQPNGSSTYMNETQEFYGYINIDLSHIPSYPSKQYYPIMSLKGLKINNCEMSLDIRNRRLIEHIETEDDRVKSMGKNIDQPRKSNFEFIKNHLRLYANCLIYQLISIAVPKQEHESIQDQYLFKNVTLDNILYIPAYTLINQHRLQSNLTQIDDRCIRRISLLVLLTELQFSHNSSSDQNFNSRLNRMKIILLSVIQSEYSTAHRLVDDKTMQDLDAFKDEDKEPTSSNSSLLIGVELAALGELLDRFLTYRLEEFWLGSFSDNRFVVVEEHERQTTLLSLKLFKSAASHFKQSAKSLSTVAKQVDDNYFISKVERLVCRIITSHILMRIRQIIELDGDSRMNRDNGVRPGRNQIQQYGDQNLWNQLLYDIKYIDQDLRLYWSTKGLDGVLKSEQELVTKSGPHDVINISGDLGAVIESKMKDFLRQ